jgi:hypothetical protein
VRRPSRPPPNYGAGPVFRWRNRLAVFFFLSLSASSLAEVAAVLAAGFAMFTAGRALLWGYGTPELQFIAGWGGYCVLTTCWGVATAAPFSVPTIAFLVVGSVGLAKEAMRPRPQDWRGLLRILILSSPLWLVMAGVKPSQPDTFANLLPNAAYLSENGFFPAQGRAAGYSTLPALPYNHQLAAYFASWIAGRFLPGAMSLFSVQLHVAAGLLFARCFQARPEGNELAPPWWACALGLAAATLLNPGFTPRYSFSSYGEGPMAVVALFAAWAGLRLLDKVRANRPAGRDCWSLALVLAAMINIKQMSFGLAAAIVSALMILAVLDRRIDRPRALSALAASAALPIVLYLSWRFFVLTNFTGGELKPLPLLQWHWTLLPQILFAMVEVVSLKGFIYAIFAAAGIAFALRVRRHRLDSANQALLLAMLVFALYTGFLVLTYIGHFPEEWSLHAHSYFRYSAHVSLIFVLGFILLAEPNFRQIRATAVFRVAAAGVCIATMAAPLAFVQRLRFDRVMPQPLVWDLADMTVRNLNGEQRIALVLPGDNGSVAAMLELGIRLGAASRRSLEFIAMPATNPARALEEAAANGATLALVSCITPDLSNLPLQSSAVLRRSGMEWHSVEIRALDEPSTGKWVTFSPEPFCKTAAIRR